jgi:hypothetical protein
MSRQSSKRAQASIDLCSTCHQQKNYAVAPPYWRSGGAIFQLEMALNELGYFLEKLIPVHAEVDKKYEALMAEIGDENFDDDDERGIEILDPLMDIESTIRAKADLACLMSAIEAEDQVNRFCVFNLDKDLAESIEKLSVPEKLLVAAGTMVKRRVKETAVYEGAKRLVSWRNAFAHGHCVDRPTKSLRHNHLIHPDGCPELPTYLADMRALVTAFLRIYDYLREISVNPYTQSKTTNIENVRALLVGISKYRLEGDLVYKIKVLP